ncbi:MAG: MBOAT family O-acyltransferase [Thermodesulfobacteriota bacterium]
MLFNSIDFAIFLPIVFLLYWFVTKRNLRAQNLLLLICSYIFYGWWDWRFLLLIFFSSLVDFFVGIGLSRTNVRRKRILLLLASIFVNIGFLGFFKYYNFFLENFIEAFSFFGRPINPEGLNIILPVGISFYTFQTLSYSIDVYKRRLEPTRDIIAFFAFVSFFPQLVAGPIERATNLLSQFYAKRIFDYDKAVDGMRQILWGLFKKIVIADNCATYANEIFNNSSHYSGSTLLLGVIFFAFQIYGDFSGYSDIAIGTSRLFGFNLKKNFAFPYFSRDIAEFWRRWHMSLTTWFRDYVYIPLGGSRGGTWKKIRNVFVIFVVSGFWHGANWKFIIWGALNALCFLPLMLTKNHRKHTDTVAEGRILPGLKEVLQIGVTFSLTLVGWVFFRAESVHHAFAYIGALISPSLFVMPTVFPRVTLLFIGFFMLIEWFQREKEHALEFRGKRYPAVVRWGFYYVLILAILWFGGKQQEFIYFQF